MAKFNYQQARKQKEVARKARQQEKQQRRAASKPGTGGEQTEEVAAEKVGDPREPNPGNGT